MSKYLKFFGLKRAPFEGRSADALLLETGPLRRAVSWIRDAFHEGTVIIALTGSRGVGKTCMARVLPHLLEGRVACLLDASLGWEEIQRSISEQLELPEGELGRSALLERRFSEPGRLVVAIDNAEQLLPEPCAALRGMIANANEPGGTLLHCVLLANPERCAAPTPAAGWVQATQPRIELAPMLARELQRYIEARLENAGWGGGELFSEGGLDVIHQLSGGFPRTANRICEQALVQAAGTGQRSIDGNLIESLDVRPHPRLGAGAEATEPALRSGRRRRSDSQPTAPAPRPSVPPAPHPRSAPTSGAPGQHRQTQDVPPSASEAEPPPRTRLSPPAVLWALASRVAWNWKLPAALVGGVAAVLLANQVVTLSGGEGPGSTPIEPRTGDAEPPPQDPSQPSPALTPVRDWAVDPMGAPPEPTDTCGDGTSDPMATPQEIHLVGIQSSEGSELLLCAPTDAAELTAATETPPKPPAPTDAAEATEASPKPSTPRAASSGWLDHLDVSFDAQPTGSATRRPTLALPEPDLARRLSPAGASATE